MRSTKTTDLYGDTSGILSGQGSNQMLVLPDIYGGSAFGDAYRMISRAQGGNDILIGGNYPLVDTITVPNVVNYLYGDAFIMSQRARGGNDTLTGGTASISFTHGGAAENNLYGDADQMQDSTIGGNDILSSGKGTHDCGTSNTLYGDARIMGSNAAGGNDTLYSTTTGQDSIWESTSNYLYGDAYEMDGNTKGGSDRLISSAASDNMYGDAAIIASAAKGGADTFVFAPSNGDDIIYDFRHADSDKIDLIAFGFVDITQLTMTALGNGITQITAGSSLHLTLIGIADPSLLLASDFILQ